MDAKSLSDDQLPKEYEDFEPTADWERDDTLIIRLPPGFRKEQLKVQVTSAGKLRISGERPVGDKKWSRFRKELTIPSNLDSNTMTAKFEGGTLYIKCSKKAANPQETASSSAEPPELEKPTNEEEKEKKEKQKEKEKEKVAAGDANGKSTEGDHANNVSQKNLEDHRSHGFAAAGNPMQTAEKTGNLGGFGDDNNAAKKDTGTTGQSKLGYYKQLLGGLAPEMKKSLAVAAGLVILLVGLYVKYAISSHGESEN